MASAATKVAMMATVTVVSTMVVKPWEGTKSAPKREINLDNKI